MSLTVDNPTAVAEPRIPVMPVTPLGEEVILWPKPRCVQCTATERDLTSKGVPFRKLDLTENPEALEALKAAGWAQAPVVQHAHVGLWVGLWAGFRPDKINEVAERIAA